MRKKSFQMPKTLKSSLNLRMEAALIVLHIKTNLKIA
jgi:hypothetical protein